MNKAAQISDFAPVDPTDGRKPLEWESKYTDPVARRAIRAEAVYLAIFLLVTPIAIIILWLSYPNQWFELSNQEYTPILEYGIAWLSGALGGTLFAVKWLYHTVAKRTWHLDRRLWRIFTPLISGSLAFAFVALISSGLLRILDQQSIDSHAMVIGISFLVGYFSDNALAKFAAIAASLFGVVRMSGERSK